MIKLRRFEESDFEDLINWMSTDKSLLQWSGTKFTYPLTKIQLQKYLDEMKNNESNILIYSAINTKTKELIGHIALSEIDKENKSARVGKIVIDKIQRNKGFCQTILREALKIAFDELTLHRVSLGVFDYNKEAISCYKKVGFVLEGTLRDERKYKDEYWNLNEMSILEHEWKQNR